MLSRAQPNGLVADGLEAVHATAPPGSVDVDGMTGLYLAHREHAEKPLQNPIIECLGRASTHDQRYLRAHSAISDHLKAVTLDLGERTSTLC